MTESKLYRALSGLTSTRPLFTVSSAGRTWTDSSILSMTITHGKSNPEGGLYPATCEVEVAGAVGILHDRHITVRLADAAATALAGTTAAAPRFTGRVATQRVTTHAVRGRGPRHTSVLRCSSWSALYLATSRPMLVSAAASLSSVLSNMFTRTQEWVGRAVPLSFAGDWSDMYWNHDQGSTGSFSTVIGALYAETGFLLRQRRDGTVQPMTLQYRADAGVAAAADWWPITLGHAVTAVDHEQPTDANNVGIELRRRRPSGDPADWMANETITNKWAWPGSRDGVPATDVGTWDEYDWSHTVWRTEQYRHAINAISSRVFRVAFSTPSLTVDLLALARSTRTYDRTMLSQLLRLEHGDPVVFGGDWSALWNGIYYAEQITETITPHSWTLELALYAPPEVTGHYGQGGGPKAPARIWSQATYPWSDESRNWSDA